MPVVEVSIVEGRPLEARLKMMSALTDAVVATLDVPRETVRVIVQEVPPWHWAVGGVPKGVPPS